MFKIIIIMDHLHGLCKNCLTKCTQTFPHSKNQNECSRCSENPPQVIYEDNGSILILCTKCYIKELGSPRKRSDSTKQNNSLLSSMQPASLFHSITKSDALNKSFFTAEGKMIKKIEKYFSKFEGKAEDAIRDLSKKSIIITPPLWEKIVAACNKTASIMLVLVNQNRIFGVYHSEPIRITDRPTVEDKQSGFFMSNKTKMDFNFYKPNSQIVTYNSQQHSISLGKTGCLEVLFEGTKVKVRCDVFTNGVEEWNEGYVYKF